MTAPVLEARGLRSGYGAGLVLRGVDLAVRPGEAIGLMGRNGMGKTTLIRTLLGQVPARAGAVLVDGREVTREAPIRRARRGIAVVPEGRGVFASLSVRENLRLAARPAADGTTPWPEERVLDLFPRLGQRLGNRGDQLSGGEQQMLAIGRAMMSRPKLLMLDEPSMGLSPLMMQRIMSTITELKSEGVTILLVEQNAQAALSLADYGYVLEVGKIVLQDTGAKLLGDENVRKAYLGED